MSFNWNGDKMSEEMHKKAGKVLHDVGEAILSEANKTVPHDTGALELSGTVETNFKELITAIGYDTPYAVRWHEAEPGSVSFRDPNARTKWLEKTCREMAGKIERYLADGLR